MAGLMDSYAAKLNASCTSLFTTKNKAMTLPYRRTSESASRVFEQMDDLRRSLCLCDVTLVVQGKRINAHRLLLASCSNYFKAMFTSEMAESKQQEIQMVDIDDKTLETLVDFCYTGEITITDVNVQSILPAACLLQIQEVQDVCCEFLKKQLDPTNCLGIRSFADTHGCRDLFKVADKYMLEHFQDVVATEEFLLLPMNLLIDVVSNEELDVRTEENVFKAVMNWVRHDLDARQSELPKVLEHVRLPLCSNKFLVKTVSQDPLIKADIKCRDLVDEAKNYILLPEERIDHQGPRYKPRRPIRVGELLYAVGGWCSGDAIASVERMDSRTGEWRTVAPMSKRRCGVGVAVLNNLLYAVGGHDGQKYLKCVERYDPHMNKWSSDVSPTSTCRTSVGVAVLGDYLYAVGGQDGVSCLNIVERYDVRRNEWIEVAPMCSRRLGVSVSVLEDCLYAVGGADGQCPLNTVESYVHFADVLKSISPRGIEDTPFYRKVARTRIAHATSAGFIPSGDETFLHLFKYDPRCDQWHSIRPMNTRRKHLGSAVYNGCLYAVGGRADSCELATCEKYDPAKNMWVNVMSMNNRRSGVGLAVVNNQLYAVGGFDGSAYLKSVEVLEDNDSEVAQWRHSGMMAYRRLGGGVGVITLTNDQLAACVGQVAGTSQMENTLADLGYDLNNYH